MRIKRNIKITSIFIIVGIIALTLGVTIAFFNYTRTGGVNTVKVGRINFLSEQNGNITLTNVFPITSEEAETDTTNAKSITITVTGDTDYSEGLEYVVTASDVNNTVNGKTLPIALEVTVNGSGLGTEETGDYYTNRETYTTSKYKNEHDGKLEENSHLLVGYISPNITQGTASGINGTINIKAYIDKDKLLISDTWNDWNIPTDQMGTLVSSGEGKTVFTTNEWNAIQDQIDLSFKVKVEAREGIWVLGNVTPSRCFSTTTPVSTYVRNPNMNVNTCTSIITDFWGEEEEGTTVDVGETYQAYCNGTGTIWGNYLQQDLDDNIYNNEEIYILKTSGIIEIGDYMTSITDYDVNCGNDVVIPNKVKIENKQYIINQNMDVNKCVNKFEELGATEALQDGETLENFCNGTGTLNDNTLQQFLTIWIEMNEIELLNELETDEIIIVSNLSTIRATVIGIENNAFAGKGLTSVTIPDSVINIRNGAFINNDIICVKVLPATNYEQNSFDDGVIIHHEDGSCPVFNTECFYGIMENNGITIIKYNASCGTDVVIPSNISGYSVKAIGSDSFYGENFSNKGLTSVIIPNSVTKIGPYAFANNQLTNVVIPNSVTSIGYDAFYDNKLASITIPNSVTSIDSYAFADNQLTNVVIPNSVTSLGYYAFDNNNIVSLDIDMSNIPTDFIKNQNMLNLETLIIGKNVTAIERNAFYIYPTKLETISINMVNIPSDFIDNHWFSALTNIIIGNDVKTIGSSAFMSLSVKTIKSLVIGNNVTTIGDFAFHGNLLTSVIIPNSVTTIGASAFAGNQLTSVIIPNNVTTIGTSAFAGNQLTSVIIPNSVTTIEGYAFHGNLLTSVIIPNSVTTIESGAFADNQLTSVIIPNSVTTIEYSAFANNQLASITIPNSVTSIDSYAFADNQLVSLTIPNSVTTIGSNAFKNNQLTNVVIPNSVTSIGFDSFKNNNVQTLSIDMINITSFFCSSIGIDTLKKVFLGNSVTTIGTGAFQINYENNVNPELVSIVNRTRRAFDWSKILRSITGDISTTFETGIYSYETINVTITNE